MQSLQLISKGSHLNRI